MIEVLPTLLAPIKAMVNLLVVEPTFSPPASPPPAIDRNFFFPIFFPVFKKKKKILFHFI
jgi:hypothetical protein